MALTVGDTPHAGFALIVISRSHELAVGRKGNIANAVGMAGKHKELIARCHFPEPHRGVIATGTCVSRCQEASIRREGEWMNVNRMAFKPRSQASAREVPKLNEAVARSGGDD